MTYPRHASGFLALSRVGALAFSGQADAQEAHSSRKLGGVTVTDTALEEPDVKAERAESPKIVRPLLDTPQTITVITNKTLQQQNLLTLREVLSTVPGITFGAGEGGFGYGDRINLRGFSANNDISIDGVRSGAIANRNETYNIEQVEVTNGANGVFQGGGSVGGTINLITKRPQANDQTIFNAGVGTDNYYRATVDANHRFNDLIAVRLNAVYHRNDVPGREVEEFDRWGIAPAVTIGIDSPTSLTLQYEHLDDRGVPQYGIPYFPPKGGFVSGFNRQGYYGFRNVDRQNARIDAFQAIFTHQLADGLSIRNLTRYEVIAQYTVTSQPAGTFCLANNLTPAGAACSVTIAGAGTLTIPAGYFLPTGGRGVVRDIRNDTAYNQLDLNATFSTFGLEHTMVIGISALWENFTQTTGNILRAADGSNPFAAPGYYPLVNIANPNAVIAGPVATTGIARVYGSNLYTGPLNVIRSARTEGQQTSYAVYLFDAVKLSDMVEINGAVRLERFEGDNRTQNYSILTDGTLGQPTTATGPFGSSDTLFSYRIGGVFKPAPNISAYVAMGNARTPSKASVDGSCTALTCNVNPESAKNYEVGVKADLFDARLQLAAALFRNERDKYGVISGDPLSPDNVLDGKSRVDGIALSANGNITDAWSVAANYTYLDSEVIRSVSRFCLANPGTGTCTNTAALPDPAAGTQLPATPRHSGSLFTAYRFPFGLEIGYGLTYQGRHALNPSAIGSTPVYFVPDFLTHRLMVSYQVADGLMAQVNVQNVTDEDYFTTVRTNVNNSWAQPGVGRSAVLSLAYSF